MLKVLPIIFMAPASALSGTLLPQVHVLVDNRGHKVVGLVPPGAGVTDGAGVEPAGVAWPSPTHTGSGWTGLDPSPIWRTTYCTTGHEGAVGDLSCMSIFSACFGLLTSVQLAATTWSGQIWISC